MERKKFGERGFPRWSRLLTCFSTERAKLDLNFNNVIIEFKAPGLFKGSDQSASFREAMRDRLLPYILKSAKKTGVAPEDFIGIAIDGEHVCFAQVVSNEIRHNYLLPFSVDSVGMVIEACRNNFRRPVVAESLLDDFGHASEAACAVMQALSRALQRAIESTAGNKIAMLFEEWRALYGQVADLSGFQIETIERALRFIWDGSALYSMPARLFVIHTYNSLIIKLLAAEIVSAHGLTTIAGPAEAFCALMDDNLLVEQLWMQIERGQLFEAAGLVGFVEEAIFSWYIDAARTPEGARTLIPALRSLIGRLALYRTDRLGRQRDALRDFYQGLVPETLRKSLGEFYTPDWLVELTVSKIAPAVWIGPRFLDPTCGSGSFLVEVIRRKRTEAVERGLDARATVDAVLDEVWGFDLNPLAVQTARVNFLMEIADLIAAAPGRRVELPILLADAIYSPAADPEGDTDVVQYKIGSRKASLDVHLPSALAFNRARLDSVFDLMGEHVELNHEYTAVSRALVRAQLLSAEEAEAWEEPLRKTYDQVLALHRENWNGIWFRIVRNFFWSATAGQFDAIRWQSAMGALVSPPRNLSGEGEAHVRKIRHLFQDGPSRRKRTRHFGDDHLHDGRQMVEDGRASRVCTNTDSLPESIVRRFQKFPHRRRIQPCPDRNRRSKSSEAFSECGQQDGDRAVREGVTRSRLSDTLYSLGRGRRSAAKRQTGPAIGRRAEPSRATIVGGHSSWRYWIAVGHSSNRALRRDQSNSAALRVGRRP